MKLLPLTAALLWTLCATPALEAQRAAGEVRRWEHETSDLPVNPRMHFGTLPNGIRWAWMSNSEPRQRIYARLHVDVGSLGETDSEQGMAHFLEHMAFNGSTNFEAGTLVEWFQKQGMAFGADTNASTGFSETIYKLDLPTNDEETLRSGLTWLGDVAHGLLLSAEEVAAEIGVIDGEERERDSVEFRAGVAGLKDAFAGTLIATRIPIGVQSVRAAFTAESVRAFYARWYRPENLTVVIAGDLGELDPVALITAAFAGVAVPESAPADEPDLGTPQHSETFLFYSNEIPVVTLSAERVKPYVEEPFTKATVIKDLPLQYARSMLNTRFRELAKKEGAPFYGAGVSEGGGLRVLDGESLSVTCEPGKWREALAVAEQELRRAVTFGFQQAELDELRKNSLRELDEGVARESTRSSSSYVNEMLAAVEERYVPTDATTDRDVLKPAIEAITVEAAQAALAAAWQEGRFRLSAIGGLDLGEDGGAQLKAAWEESGKVEVLAPAEVATSAFAYASIAEGAGEVAERTHIEDLDFHQLRFENGVRLNIKQTDFRERQVLVTVRVGQGLLSLDPARAELEMVADSTFIAGGLEAHSADDLRRLTAGRQAGVSFGVAQDAFVLGSGGRGGGGTTPDDLLLQLELITAYLQHPGFRDEGLRAFKKNLDPTFEELAHNVGGPIELQFRGKLHGGDPRFGFPPREKLQAATIEDVKAWLVPELATGPIEVSIVGDVDVEAAVAAVARTLGKLPERAKPADRSERLGVTLVSGLRESASVPTEVPQAAVFIAFPTTDGRQAITRRSLSLLGSVVSDRLRVEVREKLGVAYSPQAGSQISQVFPGLGMTILNVAAEPAIADKVLEACLAVTDSLAADGVTADELERQREPLLKRLRDQMRTNSFWANLLTDSQARPEVVAEMRTLQSDYEGLKPEDLSKLAKQYLAREKASWIVVQPQTAAAEAGEPAAPLVPVPPVGG